MDPRIQADYQTTIANPKIRTCINRVVKLIQSRWRGYDSEKNYEARCNLAIFQLLKLRQEFEDEGELIYYLFGNKGTKNKVYWNVEAQLKEDAGVKVWPQPEVEIEKCHELYQREGMRAQLLDTVSEVFNKGILNRTEQLVLTLWFNLSELEEEREEGDISPWSIKEISTALSMPEQEINEIKSKALRKIKPYFIQYEHHS